MRTDHISAEVRRPRLAGGALVFLLFVALCVVLEAQTRFADIFKFNTGGVELLSGSGDPEGVVTAPVASAYFRTSDGTWWRKATGSGNTGWTRTGLIYFTASDRVLCRDTSGAGAAEECSMSTALDMLGTTRGSVLYRGAAGWTILGPGALNECLKSGGAGADPQYGACLAGDGGGDVTAAAGFGTTNCLIRSDGTGKGVKVSPACIDDSGNLTGTVFDAAGSGNTLRFKSWEKYVFAGCNGGTSASLALTTFSAATSPTAGCGLGSVIPHPYAEFPDSAGAFRVMLDVPLPVGFTAATADFVIMWSTSATSGDAVLQFQWNCTGHNEALGDSWSTASKLTTTALANASRLNVATKTGVSLTGCAADELLTLSFMRDKDDASDTISGATVRVYVGYGSYEVER